MVQFRNFLDWSNKAIADPRQRFYEPGIIRRFAERLAKSHYRGIQAMVKIYKRILRPETLAEFFAGNDFSRIFHQYPEDATLLILELYFAPLFA